MGDRTVGDMILWQLGGAAKISAMTGVGFFVYSDDGVAFPLPKGCKVQVQLTPSDTYRVSIWKLNAPPRQVGASWDPVTLIQSREVKAEQLKATIEDMTGLCLSL